jgi:hypothetical protein
MAWCNVHHVLYTYFSSTQYKGSFYNITGGNYLQERVKRNDFVLSFEKNSVFLISVRARKNLRSKESHHFVEAGAAARCSSGSDSICSVSKPNVRFLKQL